MNKLKEILLKGNYSCVISNEGLTYTFTQPGVRDLYGLLQEKPELLKGASVADKVIGKAAATLMILGGAKEVYADVISLSALAFLRKAEVIVTFGQTVPYISNRDNTDMCPLEKMCADKQSSEEILDVIEVFIQKMQNKVN